MATYVVHFGVEVRCGTVSKKKQKIVRIIDLVHVYKGKVETIALPGINLTISKGERVVWGDARGNR